MHAMPTVTDAASETMVRRDMTDPFLRLMTELSHKESSATRLCKNDRGSCFLVIAMVAPGEPGVLGAACCSFFLYSSVSFGRSQRQFVELAG